MHGEAPWYTRSWRASELGTRTKVAICGYLGAAVGEFGLAVAGDGSTAKHLMWTVLGSISTFLGSTLLATFLWHRRTMIPPER